MRYLSIFLVICSAALVACSGSRQSAAHIDKRPVYDSVDRSGRGMRRFSDDSLVWYGHRMAVIEVEYLSAVAGDMLFAFYDNGIKHEEVYRVDGGGQLHFATLPAEGETRLVAYSLPDDFDIPPYYTEEHEFVRYDSVTQYRPDGSVKAKGLYQYDTPKDYLRGIGWPRVWHEYDEQGHISQTTRHRICDHTQTVYTHYHPNGRVKSETVQSLKFASWTMLSHVEYDLLGRKMLDIQCENSMEEDKSSQYDIFSVLTKKEYYPGGTLRQVSRYKAFYESDEVRCGEWVYYSPQGKVARRERYCDCYNYTLEDGKSDDEYENE